MGHEPIQNQSDAVGAVIVITGEKGDSELGRIKHHELRIRHELRGAARSAGLSRWLEAVGHIPC